MLSAKGPKAHHHASNKVCLSSGPPASGSPCRPTCQYRACGGTSKRKCCHSASAQAPQHCVLPAASHPHAVAVRSCRGCSKACARHVEDKRNLLGEISMSDPDTMAQSPCASGLQERKPSWLPSICRIDVVVLGRDQFGTAAQHVVLHSLPSKPAFLDRNSNPMLQWRTCAMRTRATHRP